MIEPEQDLEEESGDPSVDVKRALSDERVLSALTVVPTLMLFVLVTLLPIAWGITAGFFRIPLYDPEWTWVGLENYRSVVADPGFRASLWRSLVFATGTITVQVVGGVAMALVISRSFRFSTLVRTLVFLPYVIPSAVVGVLAIWMTNTQWGIVNWLLVDAGVLSDPVPWLGGEVFAMLSVVVANSWKYTVFTTILVVARLQAIPEGYYEAATVAGANAWQRFRDITFPNIKGVLYIVIFLRGVWTFLKYDIVWVLTRGGPADATTVAAVHGYETAFTRNRLGEAAAISTLLFVMLVAAAVVYFVVFSPESEVRIE